jgi:hypothetical protein
MWYGKTGVWVRGEVRMIKGLCPWIPTSNEGRGVREVTVLPLGFG